MSAQEMKDSAELRKKLEQDIRDMFKLEAQRNELNFALTGVERGKMTLQDYEDDLSVAISNWIVKDLLPAYTAAQVAEALQSLLDEGVPDSVWHHGVTAKASAKGFNKANKEWRSLITSKLKAIKSNDEGEK